MEVSQSQTYFGYIPKPEVVSLEKSGVSLTFGKLQNLQVKYTAGKNKFLAPYIFRNSCLKACIFNHLHFSNKNHLTY